MMTYKDFDFSCYRWGNRHYCDVYYNNGRVRMDAKIEVSDTEVFDYYDSEERGDEYISDLYREFSRYLEDIQLDLHNGAANVDYEFEVRDNDCFSYCVKATNSAKKFVYIFTASTAEGVEKELINSLDNFIDERL